MKPAVSVCSRLPLRHFQAGPVGENEKMKRRSSKESGGTNGQEENGDKRKGEKHMKGEKCDKV